jgi:hypothetical protein
MEPSLAPPADGHQLYDGACFAPWRPEVRAALRFSLVATVIAAVSAASFFVARREAMKRGYIKLGKYDIRSEGNLRTGDLAPDLELERLDGAGRTKLSSMWTDRPLVLLFGSYT